MSNEPPGDDSTPTEPRRIPTSRPTEPPVLEELRGPSPTRPAAEIDWRLAAAGLLRNRAIVGGLGVVVVLLLVAVVLAVVGESGENVNTPSGASGTEVLDGSSTVTAARGLTGRVSTTATVRRGPGSSYTPMGTIPRASVVSVVGRSDDDLWLQVVYPPGSQLLGWVQTVLINVEGDIGELNVAGAGEGPSVTVPTGSGPVVTGPPPASATPAESPTPSAEPATRTPRPTRTTIPSVTPRTSPTPTIEEPGTPTMQPNQ